jgi:hypothetical protein
VLFLYVLLFLPLALTLANTIITSGMESTKEKAERGTTDYKHLQNILPHKNLGLHVCDLPISCTGLKTEIKRLALCPTGLRAAGTTLLLGTTEVREWIFLVGLSFH